MVTQKKSEDFTLEHFVESVPLPAMLLNGDVIRYVNDAANRYFCNKAKEKVLGRRFESCLLDESKEAFSELRDMVHSGKHDRISASISAKTLSERVFDSEIHISTLPDKETSLIIFNNWIFRDDWFALHARQNPVLQVINKALPDITYIGNRKTRKTIFLNSGYLHELGYMQTAAEDKEEPFDVLISLIHTDDRRIYTMNEKQLDELKPGEILETQYRLKKQSGEYEWYNQRIKMLEAGEDGVPYLFFGIARNIHDRVKTETRLQDNQRLLQQITQSIPDIIFIWNIHTLKPLYTNFHGRIFLGYNEKEWEQAGLSIVDPSYIDGVKNQIEKLHTLEDGAYSNDLVLYRTKSQDNAWVYHTSSVFSRDAEGKPEYIMSLSSDVTNLKQTENELLAKNHLIQKITEAIPDVFYVYNIAKKELTFSNLGAKLFLGYSLEDWKSGVIEKTLDEYSRKKTLAEIHKVRQVKEGVFIESEQKFAAKSGEMRWLKVQSTAFSRNPMDEVDSILVMVTDITDLKRARIELDNRLAELSEKNEQLEKYITSNTELEKFAYIASHDLKEPLRTIISFSQLLDKKTEGTSDAMIREYTGHIISGTKRMESLISSLLEYSRIDSKAQSFRQIDLNVLIEKITRDLSSSINEAQADIVAGVLPVIKGDELQLRQLFQNLLTNSLKFKGDVKPMIQITAYETETHHVVRLKDNGIGINMIYQDIVFRIFERLHTQDKYPGSGIGLAICKKIAERHGGKIWFESEEGKGTSFFVSLLK